MRPAAGSLFAVAVLSAATALAQLNPTVNVLPKPQAPVPGECEQGLAPAQPRTLVAETPAPAQAPVPSPSAPPPTLDLKTRLRAVEAAAQQGDRASFKAALAAAHSAANAYPRGGERTAAEDILRVYDDLETLWDYAFTSPSGAFFDSTTQNGALLKMLERYPGYDRAIADFTLKVGGTTIYPTAESRKFLASQGSRQLAQLGVKMPERIAEAPKPPAIAAKPNVKKEAHHASTARKPATKIAEARPAHSVAAGASPAAERPRAAAPTPKPSAVRSPVAERPRAAAPTPKPSAVSSPAAERPKPATRTPAPAPVPAPVVEQPKAVAPTPAPTQPAPTTTEPPPTMSQPATTAAQSAPAETATTAPTSTTNPPPAQQSGGRVNLLFAVILIVVGIGVLIVLLRASD